MLIAAMCVGWVANAQSLETYTYSTGVDESMWITVTDSTNLLVSGTADSKYSSVQSIGFAFPFANSSFTQFSVNSDGNLRLGPTVTGTANYLTPFSAANSSINNPKINFLGCDGYYVDTLHYVYAQNTVDASNDSLLVVEFCLGTYTSSTRSQQFRWQVHMYPSGNIVVVFAPVAPNQAPATSNQKGICFNSGDGWIIASDNTATHFTSGSSTTWSSGSWPSPNTYYAFTRPVITCPSPSAITLHNFGSTTANITFTPAGNETSWIGTITPGIMGYTETMLSDTNVNLMFLTPNTEYSISVRAICGVGDTSFPTSLTFRTACSPTAIPYTENFDSVTTSTTAATGAMPSCWIIGAKDVSMTATQSPQVYYSTATSYSTSGSYSLRLYYRGYVALPIFDVPVDSLMVKFQVKQTASNYWLEVGVMDNPYDASTFVPIDTIHTANTVNHEYHEVLFNNYTGSGQFIAFHNILVPSSTTSYSSNYLDDIEVDRLPSCITPNHVNVSNISTTGATISWVGNAANYTVVYGSDTNLLTSVDVSTNSVTLTSLAPATHYYVKVKAVCSASDESAYSSFEDFTTPCEALSVPYAIDFENVTTSTVSTTEEMPSCWAIGPADVSMTSTQAPQVYYGTSNAHGGSYSFRMYYRGYVALPMFTTPVDSLMLKFWLKQTAAAYQLEVGVMSDPTDATTFVAVDTINNASTAYEHVEVMLNNYTGNGQYIAFHNITTNTYNYSYNYIDDLQVTLLPTCFTPQNVAASNVDAHSATISWTGNASNYVVVCGDDTMNVTGNSITLTGLLASTTYSVSVKAVCSATDESDFSTPISFTTLCEAIALPYTEDFDNLSGNLPNCWTKIGAGTAAKYSSTTYAHSGNYSLRFNGATSNLVALPEMDAPTNTLTMSFWTRPESFTNSNCGTFSVGYVTDVTDANSFVALETYTYSDFTEIENKVVSFASAPATATIALRHTPNSTAWYWFVDDIEVTVNTPECVATTWITGDSTGSSYYTPVNNYYNYTLTETIIEAAEIGGPMRIDTISLHYMYSSPMTNKTDVTIWLQPTTKSSFSSTSDIDLLDSSIAVQIFSDSMNFSYGWNDIVLPTPYVFDGTSNLMLIVDDNSYDYDGSSYKFSTTSCSDYKTIAWYSDGQNPDPVTGNNSLTGNTYSSSKTRYMYRVRMALKGCDLTTCHKPNDLAVSGVTPYGATLSWSNNNSSTTTYTVINMADSTVVSSSVSAGSFAITGLTPETSYAFGVYANCAADDSSIVATVTFATPATCVVPSSFACGNITSSTATLSWSDNTNTGATYTIFDMSDTSVLATGLTGNTYTVTGLTPNTDYTFGIVANCSATDASSVVTVSARTSCVPETLPFTEDFSANLSSNLCWRGATGTTAAQVFAGASLNLTTPNWTYASSTRDGLEAGHYYKNVYGSSVKSWIITPAIDLSTVTSAQLSFDVALTDWNNAALPDAGGDTNTSQSFMVIVSPDGGNTWSAANATVWQNGTGDYTYASLADTVYQNKVISLNQYVGDTIKIAFYCQSLWSGGDNDLHIDNIAVTEASPVDSSCHVTIYAEDAYGDGWNGGTITIMQGTDTVGVYSMAGQGVSSTRIYDTITYEVLTGVPITFEWAAGSWAEEVSFTIVDGSNSAVYYCADGSMLSDAVFFTLSDACPSCSGIQDLAVSDITSNSVILTWSSDNSSATYTVYNMSDTSVIASGLTTTTYTVTGLTAETNYQFGVAAACSATESSAISTVNAFTGYCSPNPTSVDGNGITSVSFGGMTNTTHPTSAGYANYSTMSGSVPAGTTASVDITYATGYTYGTIIWVDWNSNLIFEGNEVVYAGVSASSNPTTLTATFDIPATQALGNYRMRIVGADSYFDSYTGSIAAAADANPCATYSWGVAEDYTLIVTTMPECLAVTGLTATATYNSVTLNWTDANNTGATYTVYDMSDTSVVATGITGTTYTVTGLTPNTYYTFGVAANCSATDASSVVTVAIHTPCVAVAIPFYESFDTNSATLGCWTAYSMNTANSVGLSIFNTNGIALRFSSYYSASDYNQYAFSPVFNYTGTDNTLNFSVQYATYGSSDHLYFGYITPTDTVWSTEYYTTSGQSDVQTYTASIPATATQIAFHYYGSYAYYAWVDSVSVTEAPAAITMTISSADTTMGTTSPVPGTYTYLVGDTITVTAVPNTGYVFDYWVLSLGALTDTITLSTYTGVVPAIMAGASFELVAHFAVDQYTLTLATADATMGTTIPAPGTYSYYPGDTLTITAVPATNCHFVQWNDGDTNATRLITVTGDATYTATFDYNPITITLVNSDTAMGSITPAPGIYTFHVGDTAVAQATPATGYHFNQWMINMAGLTDSMPNNPVTMILPTYLAGASITMTATYAPNLYSIDVYANDNTLGTVTGTGQYAYNSYATITATPADHCIFVQWNDGDTNAVRNVLVTGNASYTATFQAIPQHEVTLTVYPENSNSGSVTGAGLYYEGESVTITATPNEGYHFLGWGLEEGTDFDYVIFSHDPIYTFTMGETNIHYYAVFEEDATPATVHISYDSYAGTVFINEVETSDYEGFVGDTIILRAVANTGFRFLNWEGEGVEDPTAETITYVIRSAETTINAYFEHIEGIIDVNGDNITIYSTNNNIIVRGAEQQTIRVFDVVGRLVAQRSNANDEETIAMTNTGVYLVKVGDAPARRVVVRR